MFNFVGLVIRNDASLYTYLQSTGHNTTVDKVLGYTQFIGQCVFYYTVLNVTVTPYAHACMYLHMQKYMPCIHRKAHK